MAKALFIELFPSVNQNIVLSFRVHALFLCSWKHVCCCFRWKKRNKTKGKEVFALMEKQYAALGPVSYVSRFSNVKVTLLQFRLKTSRLGKISSVLSFKGSRCYGRCILALSTVQVHVVDRVLEKQSISAAVGQMQRLLALVIPYMYDVI